MKTSTILSLLFLAWRFYELKQKGVINLPVIDINYSSRGITGTWDVPPAGEKYRNKILEVEKENGLPHMLLGRLAYQESGFNEDVINGKIKSAAGAEGIVQIIPKWHPNVDTLNPFESLTYAGKWLRQLRDKFGSWTYAVMAYNWGPGNVQKWIDSGKKKSDVPKETMKYVADMRLDGFLNEIA